MNILDLNALLNPTEHISDHFDIGQVDFEWVQNTINKRELRCAYNALKTDDRYPDLLDVIIKKLKKIDPLFKIPNPVKNNYSKAVNKQKANSNKVKAFLYYMNKSTAKQINNN